MTGTIVNGLPMDVNESKPGFDDPFIVPGRGIDQFSVTHIRDTACLLYTGDGDNIKFPVTGFDVAKSICRDYALSLYGAEEDIRPFLLALEGEFDEEEVEEKFGSVIFAAREMHERWLKRLVMFADDDWGRFKNHQMISDLQRFAARELGLEREWMTVVESGLICPACMTGYKPGQVICANCRFVLDKDKYKLMDFAPA